MKELLALLSTILLLIVLGFLSVVENIILFKTVFKFVFSIFTILIIFGGFLKFYEFLFKKEE